MNNRIVHIILLASFCIVVLAYSRKSRRHDHVDYVAQSLAGLKKILPPDARLDYRGVSSDPHNHWEMYLLSRYALAPVVLGPAEQTDSVLMVFRNDADTFAQYTGPETQVLWENRDSTYHYLLIKQ